MFLLAGVAGSLPLQTPTVHVFHELVCTKLNLLPAAQLLTFLL